MLHSEKISRELFYEIAYLRKESGGYNFYKTKKANTKAFKKYFTLKNDYWEQNLIPFKYN